MRGLTVVSPDNSGGSSPTDTTGQTGLNNWLVSVEQVVSNIQQAIQRTMTWDDGGGNGNGGNGGGHGYQRQPGMGDRWVSGEVNWDTYDLPTLVSMVALPASPAQVDTVASAWRANGAAIAQSAENLNQSLTTLMNYWQGPAADAATKSVTDSANWISDVGETASKMADTVEDSGGALQSAQNTMPGQPTNSFWSAYNTAADGASTGSAGGPFGAAAGAMSGGLTSVFGSDSDSQAQKQQAVQTMQRYEQAAMSIDTGTPTFTAPPAWGVTGVSSGGVGINGGTLPAGPSVNGSGGVGLSTMPSFADSPLGRWNALTGTSSAGGLGGAGQFGGLGAGGGHAGGMDGGFAGMFGGGFGGGGDDEEHRSGIGISSAGSQSGAGVASGAQEEPAGMVGRMGGAAGEAGATAEAGSVLEDVDGMAGGGGMTGGAVGAPMGGGMMGGMGGRGNGDGEHRRRIPIDEEPFLTGMKAAPRVIGENSFDREDGRK